MLDRRGAQRFDEVPALRLWPTRRRKEDRDKKAEERSDENPQASRLYAECMRDAMAVRAYFTSSIFWIAL